MSGALVVFRSGLFYSAMTERLFQCTNVPPNVVRVVVVLLVLVRKPYVFIIKPGARIPPRCTCVKKSELKTLFLGLKSALFAGHWVIDKTGSPGP
jgi:hypothetical protein